jgi:tetratricopeptide (TPR) repeat protein
MRQAFTPACLIFFLGGFFRRTSLPQKKRRLPQMFRDSGTGYLLFGFLVLLVFTPFAAAPQSKSASPAASATPLSTDKAIALAGQGQCKEAIPALKRAMNGQVDAESRKQAGVAGLRCSLNVDNRDAAADFIRLLSKQFPKDPEVLFVLVHAYSDLSSRTAQDLARTAPHSVPAHKLNAEALEMQGKWDDAQREYETMIEKEPNSPGLHFLLGRLLLSKPDPTPKDMERAKQAFQKELEIDPKNAAVHYVLGELASKDENWDEAITQFSEAAKLNPNFAEAYLGWGFALVTVKRYQEAIAPLRVAERLTPGNPAIHHSLGTALVRTGQKEEAEKEFAIHRSLTTPTPTSPEAEKPQ